LRSKLTFLAIGLVLAGFGLGADEGFKTIFDGKSADGWLIAADKPMPKDNVQEDGLNPHKSGGYIVVHDQKHEDFVLDFDYKLSKGCNSGIFIRVGDLKDPVMSGIEVAIDDTTGHGFHDSGAFYDLVKPEKNAQKPQGEWNHMTVTAKGPKIDVVLNGETVSKIDLNEWPDAGTRPDGSKHKFTKVAMKSMIRGGYLGFQDHGQDCWYKNVKVKDLK